jgi:hypothetical protein
VRAMPRPAGLSRQAVLFVGTFRRGRLARQPACLRSSASITACLESLRCYRVMQRFLKLSAPFSDSLVQGAAGYRFVVVGRVIRCSTSLSSV